MATVAGIRIPAISIYIGSKRADKTEMLDVELASGEAKPSVYGMRVACIDSTGMIFALNQT
jgi:hypothetical protein